ncbi:hypothetical protein EDC01DRAFT_674089 [Geopyxis carbonaria]|nr:hypothetical protein EDC01DRAFT_674089 [Geopyxis carbonaria]
MHRSTFTKFPRPHELLAAAATTLPSMAPPFSHSRARNRSSGGSSVSSHQGNLLIDSSDDDGGTSVSRSRTPASRSKSRSRSVSPPWEGLDPNAVPLLPMHGQSGGHSRSASVYRDDDASDDGAGTDGWRIGEGSAAPGGFAWARYGQLGNWLWGTQRGWMAYVGFLVVLYGGSSLALLVMNRFILWTGVYKFGYPITTTFLELLFTQLFLWLSASITRSFSRSLHALGLGCIVAPTPKPPKGKRRASSGGLREFAYRLRQKSSGGVFEFRWQEIKIILPLAVVYSLKIMLSNLSFAYTQLQIYQVSRVGSLLLCVVLTHFFHRTQSLSVTTLSSCITMVLSLTMVSLRPGTRFAIEGFLAGIFSTLFVAAYPVLLARTYTTLLQTSSDPASTRSGDLLGDSDGGVLLSGDGKDDARAAWKLLHYVNTLALVVVVPWVLFSGELRDVSRNCYFLDVAFFWLMIAGAGVAAWATFVSGFLLVRATSPLTMVVTTYPRSAFQTMLLVGFKLPTWSWVGVLMCWGSSVWYLVGRRRECGPFFSIEEDDGSLGRRGRARTTSI